MAATPQTGRTIHENRVGHLTQLNMRLNLGTYATGGVAFDPLKYGGGPSNATTVIVTSAGLYSFQYDYVNKLIKGFVISTGAEIANAVDLSAVDVHVVVWLA